MGHYCQCVLLQWALEQAAPDRRDALEAPISRWDTIVEHYGESRSGSGRVVELMWPGFDFREMGDHLARLGLVRFGTIGAATIRGIRTQAMVDTILTTLKAEPDRWLAKDFLPWWHEAVG